MQSVSKPYSEACLKNRSPILNIIESLFSETKAVLEVGSGTGQHAVYFAEKLSHLIWYTSDLEENHAGIKMWLEEVNLPNTRPPAILDVTQSVWPMLNVDAVFSANTAHIMHWHQVEALFNGVGELLPDKGLFVLYGPFNFNDKYTSESNKRFDGWLKARDPESGIRNFEDLDKLANHSQMLLRNDYKMPANNRILYWEKQI